MVPRTSVNLKHDKYKENHTWACHSHIAETKDTEKTLTAPENRKTHYTQGNHDKNDG